MLVFFFSSRRRHTRLQGDWSSDVCSSDLSQRGKEGVERLSEVLAAVTKAGIRAERVRVDVSIARSEERRVGKEGRTTGATKPRKRKNVKRYDISDIRTMIKAHEREAAATP